MSIELADDIADALYKALLRPERSLDREGSAIYPININLALELRRAIAEQKEKK